MFEFDPSVVDPLPHKIHMIILKQIGGRGGTEKRFPGLERMDKPFYIPADHFFVRFRSDGSNTDWGFKFVAFPCAEIPQEADPMEELRKINSAVVMESSHPYFEYDDSHQPLSIPGATAMAIVFDPRRSEFSKRFHTK